MCGPVVQSTQLADGFGQSSLVLQRTTLQPELAVGAAHVLLTPW
jgi:hypothetical protein